MVKIGITSYSLVRAVEAGEMDIFGMIDWVVENGGEQLEICPCSKIGLEKFADAEFVKQVREYAAKKNLPLSSYTIGANFIQPDAETVEKEIRRIEQEVEHAAALGVTRMRHDAGWRTPDQCSYARFEKDLPVFADACGRIADKAAKYGIVTSVENHGYFVQGSERVQRLVLAVNRPNFRTTMDVGNFQCADEDSVTAVKNNVPFASMIHFKDFYIRENMPVDDGFFRTLHGRYLRGSIVGHGDLDTPAIVKVIQDSGYDGFVSVEFEGLEECRMGTLTGMKILRKLFGGQQA